VKTYRTNWSSPHLQVAEYLYPWHKEQTSEQERCNFFRFTEEAKPAPTALNSEAVYWHW
jgi:hypothetical protein